MSDYFSISNIIYLFLHVYDNTFSYTVTPSVIIIFYCIVLFDNKNVCTVKKKKKKKKNCMYV